MEPNTHRRCNRIADRTTCRCWRNQASPAHGACHCYRRANASHVGVRGDYQLRQRDCSIAAHTIGNVYAHEHDGTVYNEHSRGKDGSRWARDEQLRHASGCSNTCKEEAREEERCVTQGSTDTRHNMWEASCKQIADCSGGCTKGNRAAARNSPSRLECDGTVAAKSRYGQTTNGSKPSCYWLWRDG